LTMEKVLDLGKWPAQTHPCLGGTPQSRNRDGVDGFGRRGILGDGGAGPERRGTALGICEGASASSRIVSVIRVTADGRSEGEAGAV
jgi:hypothetical protein